MRTEATSPIIISVGRTNIIGPRREKTGHRDFRPGLTQTGLYSQRRRLEGYKLEILNLRRKGIVAKLVCAFFFRLGKNPIGAAHLQTKQEITFKKIIGAEKLGLKTSIPFIYIFFIIITDPQSLKSLWIFQTRKRLFHGLNFLLENSICTI